MIGEDLDSVMNARVDKYNEALRQVASNHGVTCLPLHDRLISPVTDRSSAIALPWQPERRCWRGI